jgi:hypothetical protein
MTRLPLRQRRAVDRGVEELHRVHHRQVVAAVAAVLGQAGEAAVAIASLDGARRETGIL